MLVEDVTSQQERTITLCLRSDGYFGPITVPDRVGVYFDDAVDLGSGGAKSGVHFVPILWIKGTLDCFDCSEAVESSLNGIHDCFTVINEGKSEMRVTACQ